MPNTPYQSPESNITPLQPPMPARPLAVYVACIWFAYQFLDTCIILLPGHGIEWRAIPSDMGYLIPISMEIAGPLIRICLLYAIFKCKGWARWAMLGVGMMGLLAEALLFWMANMADARPELQSIMLEQLPTAFEVFTTLLFLPACALLFFGKGGQWFAAGRKRA